MDDGIGDIAGADVVVVGGAAVVVVVVGGLVVVVGWVVVVGLVVAGAVVLVVVVVGVGGGVLVGSVRVVWPWQAGQMPGMDDSAVLSMLVGHGTQAAPYRMTR